MLDVAQEINKKQLKGYIVSLDISKAFDSVKWKFMQKAMDCFNISKKFQRWISVLYVNARAVVMNNGYETEQIRLQRGIRQGDPISAYIFVIAIEVLAMAIRKNKYIEGINIADTEFKIMQFANDTTCFAKNKKALGEFKKLLKKFAEISGLVINETKTNIAGLGQWKKTSGKSHGFNISPDPI